MSGKRHYFTVGHKVKHRKTGKVGEVIHFTGNWETLQTYQIRWEDGTTTKVPRKHLQYVGY